MHLQSESLVVLDQFHQLCVVFVELTDLDRKRCDLLVFFIDYCCDLDLGLATDL